MFNLVDDYCWNKYKQILTYDYHNIRGLNNFTHWNLAQATQPSPLHYHKNSIEIHCLIKGSRVSYVGDSVHTITGNELFMTFPGEIHGNGDLPQSPYEFYGLQIDLSDPDHILCLDQNTSRILYDLLGRQRQHRHLKMTPDIIKYLRLAFDIVSNAHTPSDSVFAGSMISAVLFGLHLLEPVIHDKQTQSEKIQKALFYVSQHYRENITLPELAEYTGYSLSRFKTRFKEEIGITPAEYITLQKIEYAKFQLRTSNDSITQIGLNAGFSSANYFSSVFRKLTTSTPGEYRSAYLAQNYAAVDTATPSAG